MQGAADRIGGGDYLVRHDGYEFIVRDGRADHGLPAAGRPRSLQRPGAPGRLMQLPAILAEIAEVAGEDAALAIAAARGGTQVYIPPVPGEDHWLCKLIGTEAALAVCARLTCGLAGRRVDLPLGSAGRAAKGRELVDAMLRDGRSERDIALATGYTARGVRLRRATLPERDRQLKLF